MKSDTSECPIGAAIAADARTTYGKDRRTDRLLRKPDVTAKTGLSVSAIYRLETAGRFPRRRRIGLRSVAWYESDIEDFIADPLGYRSGIG
ncbi:AlpA family transcriptional regulator [Sphingobium lactosutens]|uniref:helix-turn-helix transcriptional regulator n=1 Tax=Sphingobium lactosutens TaxID=522773 RepID=UPI0015BE5BC7|nr:AlpA family transcriptional regulator [Sphingobium lactosutens]NWK98686.1 AlpA family transcriptional regulator [Sphingobium lactosutens]